MADSSQAFDQSPYSNQPLGSGEIRLLVTESVPVPLQHVFPWLSEEATISLTTKVFRLDQKPDFHAISYVWGTAPASIRVPCNGNGRSILITPTAYEMLANFAKFQRLWLWVDAVCIDQGNEVEKAGQIPLMRQIYAKAMSVAVWLGAGNPAMHAFMIQFDHLVELSKTWLPNSIKSGDEWRGKEWPRDDDIVWEGLMRILDHDWFRRLWTFQEIVLAGQAALVCGTTHIDAPSFMNFVTDGIFKRGGYIYYDPRVADRLPSRPKYFSLAYSAIMTIKNSRIDLQSGNYAFLAELLFGLRDHRVKEPVDRIWSIAGLLSEELQAKLTSAVDYSEQGRAEYHKTYVKFFKAAITIVQSVSLLMLPPTIGRDDDLLPSWCSDLAAKPMCDLRISGYWNQPVAGRPAQQMNILHKGDDTEKSEARARAITNHLLRDITFRDHDDTLHVQGFVIDRIREMVQDPDVRGQDSYREEEGWDHWNMENPVHVAAVKWFEEGLSLARRLSHTSDEEIPPHFLMSILADWRITPEAERVVRNASKSMTTGGYDYFRGLEEGERSYVWSMMIIIKFLVGHCFFATAGGRFGIAVPGCKVGDEVCALYGGEALYNMRRIGSERSTVKFCGVAFIPFLMEQHQRDAAKLQEDEIFGIQ
ncbi:hypothetical protein HBI73_139430 [Parastagonospora nodorum]|nr:hypothetical protein HBH75_169150 [Parastagonospora nodorum]KAH5087997.1 hypothetical protein HBI73_139430 [Parastagonospora nodorum]KAH5419051.1 hypothetical protein HBI46_109520 [Parastagonospora nodorum]KAH5496874.1 hypothetical protein HBI31_099950 [Parastagonospora nodorum]